MLKHKELSEKVITAAYAVHKELGNGFVEKIYKKALEIEVRESGVKCNSEVPLSVSYHGQIVGDYFADLVIEDKIIVEIKAVSDLLPAHEVQLVNYLKATGLHVGLLINFGQSVKVKRRVFGYDADTDEHGSLDTD
ncbi:MAG: GxxExxY protein [Planctomycetaceae bacterium]|nr:GxxExxY protein [Planctomycetaceae bacterium]